MNALVPGGLGALPAAFADEKIENELGAGISGSLGVIGYKGKTWSIKYSGDERLIMRPDGDGAANSIEVVVIKAGSALSKIFYKNGYVEGSSAAPDCFSTNGVSPDPQSTEKQNAICATCPMNAWGSRTTDSGKPGKACSDSKRVVVVPASDIDNEQFGGPMLLRIPAASLKDLKAYGEVLAKVGYPPFAVSTRISFDPKEAYPKFVFSAVRALTNEEALKIKALRVDPRVDRILGEALENSDATPGGPSLDQVFEQPPTNPAGNAAPKPSLRQAAKPAQEAQSAPAAAEKPAEGITVAEAKKAASAARKAEAARLAAEAARLAAEAAEEDEDEGDEDAPAAPVEGEVLPPEKAAGPADFDKMLDGLL